MMEIVYLVLAAIFIFAGIGLILPPFIMLMMKYYDSYILWWEMKLE